MENIEKLNGGVAIQPGDTGVTIEGTGFGSVEGVAKLNFAGQGYTFIIESWTDTFIVATAPNDLPSGVTSVCSVTAFGNPVPLDSNYVFRNTRSDAVAVDAVVGTQVVTSGTSSFGDGGAGSYVVVGPGFVDDSFFIQMDNGNRLSLVKSDFVSTTSLGALGNESDTNKLQTAISSLDRFAFLQVPLDETFINDNIEGFSNVPIKGNQRPKDFRGLQTYRRVPDSYLKGSLTPLSFDFEYSLPVYSALNSAKICFVGDSLMTYGADSLTTQDVLPVLMQHKFLSESKKTLEFTNRAISGQTWTQFRNKPTSFPSWYVDQNVDWYQYVIDQDADLVVFGFGMNDSSSFNADDFVESVEFIVNSGAEVMFITNLVPTIEPSPEFSGFGDRSGQDGRDFVANWVRSFARRNKYALLDMHDYYTQLRDGFCPAVSYFERRLTDVPVVSGNEFEGDETTFSPGFNMELLITGSDLINKVYKNDSIVIALGNYFNNIAVIEASGTDTFLIRLFGWGGYQTDSFISNVSIPDTDHRLFISISDNMFTFKPIFRGSTDAPIMLPIVGVGGEFRPSFRAENLSHTAFTTLTLDVAVTLKVNKGAFNDDVWGVSGSDADMKLPFGGNGVNHPTTLGCALIYKQFLKNFYFR